MHLPGQRRIPLQVLVDVSDEQIVITSGKENLGVWALHGVKIESQPDGFHLTLDQDEIVLNVADAARFAKEMELAQDNGEPSPTSPAVDPIASVPPGTGRDALGRRLESIDAEDRFAELRQRIDALAAALTDESVPPSDFFGRWLRLLKELNRHHGQGSMPSQLFYRLNSELLELMPAPSGPLPAQVAEAMQRRSQAAAESAEPAASGPA